ncbi:HAD-IA family hydrolase [Chryseobacterium contaminans]|uniref:HAD family hydrolase n=1 Tax=Chryseobacterium contaminans TaxID=1423959 RepID=UPI0030174DDA
MIKGVIFDLDQTLVNSSVLEEYRSRRDWQYTYNNLHLTNLFDGIQEMLNYITENNVKIAIVTNSPRPYAERLLKHHNIKYDTLIHYHSVTKRKPHSEPMIKAISELALNSEEVISLGDHDNDIISSNDSGISSVLCTWGTDGNYNCTPQSVIENPLQFVEILKNNFSAN